MAILTNNQVQNIASQISDAFAKVSGADADKTAARRVLDQTGETSNNTRGDLIVALARAATKDGWEGEDLKLGLERALSQRNDQDNSIKTFAAEITRACHRSARKHVPALRSLAHDVWSAEQAGDKKASKPCRDAFAREYHMFMRLITCASEGEVFETHDEVFELATKVLAARKLDPKRGFKALETVRKVIKALGDDFPLDGIVAAIEELEGVKLDEFKTYAREHTAAREDVTQAKNEDITQDENEDVAPTHDITSDTTPVMGASDLLDELSRA